MMAKEKEPTLIDLLAKSGAAELASIGELVAAKEAERASLTARLDADLLSLRALRKVIDLKVNGKRPRKQRQPKAASGGHAVSSDEATLISRIVNLLSKDGPALPETLARRLAMDVSAVKQSVGRCNGRLVKVLKDGKVALPGHDESRD